MTADSSEPLNDLLLAIIQGDEATALRLLAESPTLAKAQVKSGATRQDALSHYFTEIGHYIYAGDSALHVAAAAYRTDVARRLLAAGADVRVKNRRGAEPLHYAADSHPRSPSWNPEAQAAIIACLISEGADPNCVDNSGVGPLHRAVRTRGASAVSALIDGGADPLFKTGVVLRQCCWLSRILAAAAVAPSQPSSSRRRSFDYWSAILLRGSG